MITNRDQDILNFLEYFHVGTSKQLHNLFFKNTSYRYSRKRLQYLFDMGSLKRTRSTIDNSYAYYIDKKPPQLHHDILRSEIYTNLKLKYNVLEWHNELSIDHIRPDSMCYIMDNGIAFPVFIEIHLNNQFNFDKYKDFAKNNDLKAMFGIAPRVIIFTDRQVTVPSGIGIKFKVVNFSLTGLDTLFK